ncbi:MAG: Hint domain-containing protein, partial [Cyanobacteria bacterium J06636_28]
VALEDSYQDWLVGEKSSWEFAFDIATSDPLGGFAMLVPGIGLARGLAKVGAKVIKIGLKAMKSLMSKGVGAMRRLGTKSPRLKALMEHMGQVASNNKERFAKWSSDKIKALKSRLISKKSESCPIPNSFVEETDVWMCDGSTVDISELNEGDYVLARDEQTGELVCERVMGVYAHTDEHLVELIIENGSGEQDVILATWNHPMMTPDGLTVSAGLLVAGDILGSVNEELQVVSIGFPKISNVVYNLNVNFSHNFFVGSSGVWVHNCAVYHESNREFQPGGSRTVAGFNSFRHYHNNGAKPTTGQRLHEAERRAASSGHGGTVPRYEERPVTLLNGTETQSRFVADQDELVIAAEYHWGGNLNGRFTNKSLNDGPTVRGDRFDRLSADAGKTGEFHKRILEDTFDPETNTIHVLEVELNHYGHPPSGFKFRGEGPHVKVSIERYDNDTLKRVDDGTVYFEKYFIDGWYNYLPDGSIIRR